MKALQAQRFGSWELSLICSDGVFGRFDLAALCGCRTLNFCLFVCYAVCPCCTLYLVCEDFPGIVIDVPQSHCGRQPFNGRQHSANFSLDQCSLTARPPLPTEAKEPLIKQVPSKDQGTKHVLLG